MGGSAVGTGYSCGNYSVRIYASGAYAGENGKSAKAHQVMIEVYTWPEIRESALGWLEPWSGGEKQKTQCYAQRKYDG